MKSSHHLSLGAILVVAISCFGVPGHSAEPYYIAVDLGVPSGGTNSKALAVNANAKVVVGQARVGTKDVPFVWHDGQMEVIGNAASMTVGLARSVNGDADNFRIVGEYTSLAPSLKHGFVYSSDGTFQDLPMIAGHEQSTAWSINADGKIAGYTYLDLGATFFTAQRKQAVPVRWDPAGSSPGVVYSQPVLLYNGPMLNYNPVGCQYSGRGFSMANPIRLNDFSTPAIVTSWSVPTTNCLSLGTNINVLNYVAYRPIKHTADDATIGLSSWKGPAQPGFTAYPGYYPNQDIRQYANTYGVAVNNVGTEIHYEVAPLFQPGFTGTSITSFSWTENNGVSTYNAAGGLTTCNGRLFQHADVNDDNDTIGYTNVTNTASPCTLKAKGFIRPLGGTARFLLDRVSPDCGWTRLIPSDINNDGNIVGTGLRADGSSHAFLLIPVDVLTHSPEDCSNTETPTEPNQPPVAKAGPDQILEATSPLGAEVTLSGSASSDPDGDALTYSWVGDAAIAEGPTFTVTMSIGVHDFVLTVEDPSSDASSDSVRVTVQDTTAPDTSILSAQPSTVTSETQASITFTGTDIATAGGDLLFECSLDGAAWASCASPVSYSALVDGAHTFKVRAMDAAGLVDPTPATHSWTQDTTLPEIAFTSPAQSGKYTIGAAVNAAYSCSDSGSGLALCVGTLPNGAPIDTTSAGGFTFRVNASDLAGNQSSSTHDYSVGYGVCSYTVRAASRAGSTIPIKLQACSAFGGNLSAPGLVVTATAVFQTSTSTTVSPTDAGNANPDYNFRYQSDLFDGQGGYMFNLQTNAYGTGTYQLQFRIGADPVVHAVEFQIR